MDASAMKTIITTLLLGVFSLVLLGGAPPMSPQPQKGTILLLDNEQTLEGDIERVGDQYRIRRAVGETWIPSARVLALCASKDELLAFLRQRSNLYDADERLRLATWCRHQGMPEHAMLEATAADRLRPNHAPTQRLIQLLTAMRTVRNEQGKSANDSQGATSVDLDAELLAQFTTRVQPILMNACAGCHATGRGGAFKLTRMYESSLVQRRTTVSNAAAVLSQINLEQPGNSPLLSKALGIHGEMTAAPFQNRQAPAYRALEEWVRATASTHGVPQIPGREAPTVMPGTLNPDANGFATTRPNAPIPMPGEQLVPRSLPTTVTPTESATPRTVPTTATPTPAPGATEPKPGDPADPFDPEAFNRLNQPQPMLPAPATTVPAVPMPPSP